MKLSQFLAGTAFSVMTTTALALPITVNVVSADWTNVVGGNNINFVDTDGQVGNEEVRWGSGFNGGPQSGYRFDGSAPAAFTVETDDDFVLGDFSHFNFPILPGGAPSSLVLNISAELSVDGVALSEGPFDFQFLHNETPNNCNTGPNCANDLISLSNLTTSDTFTVNNVDYTLDILGFQTGGDLVNTFSTIEGQTSTAGLVGCFSAVLPTPVSAPGSLALMGLGLI